MQLQGKVVVDASKLSDTALERCASSGTGGTRGVQTRRARKGLWRSMLSLLGGSSAHILFESQAETLTLTAEDAQEGTTCRPTVRS